MLTIEGFDFFPLKFNSEGKLDSAPELERLKQQLDAKAVTDMILIAHGFRNSEAEASDLYSGFLKTLRGNFARPEIRGAIAGRTFAVAGVYWPSKKFQEVGDDDEGGVQGLGDGANDLSGVKKQLEELKRDARTPAQKSKIDQAVKLLPDIEDEAVQDKFVALVLSLLDGAELDVTEGLQAIRARSGSELLAKLGAPVRLPTATEDDDDGGVAPIGGVGATGATGTGDVQSFGSFFQSIGGRIGQFLNMTTWYQMKDRCGKVGATGTAQAVRDLKAGRPALRIHLVGHSLGGRLMAACAKSLSANPMVQAESLTLLEAAFSHYGFSANNGHGSPGFFRDVIARKVVRGPLVATYSTQDTVVGYAYAIASRLAGDNTKAVGDENDQYGGIGRNGAQKTKESSSDSMRKPGVPYRYAKDVVNCLDGSGGWIKDHSDVTNEAVTYAFASVFVSA